MLIRGGQIVQSSSVVLVAKGRWSGRGVVPKKAKSRFGHPY
jgi:hypothetical protein